MRTLDDTDRLLDLLKEAGDEPVTLDELAIVGVPEPARLLQALEREGHPLSRVTDRRADRPITCVRLRADDEAAEPVVVAAPDRRPLLLAALLALVLVLLARR